MAEGCGCPTGGLDRICYSSFVTESFSTGRFMFRIDHSCSSRKDGFGEGDSGGTGTTLVAMGIENRGLIRNFQQS